MRALRVAIKNFIKRIFLMAALWVSYTNTYADIHNVGFGDYLFELNDGDEKMALSSLKIYKNGKEVFREEDNYIYVYKVGAKVHGEYAAEIQNDPEIGLATIINIGRYTIVESISPGSCCSTIYYLLDLGKSFKVLAKIDNFYQVTISKVSDKPKFSIELYDDSYHNPYSIVSFPLPKAFLKYEDGKVKLDEDLIRKQPLDKYAMFRKVRGIKKYAKKFEYTRQGDYPYTKNDYLDVMLGEVFDLIYSGNYKQGMQLIDLTWPNDQNSKKMFLDDMHKSLSGSTYGLDLYEMNDIKYKSMEH